MNQSDLKASFKSCLELIGPELDKMRADEEQRLAQERVTRNKLKPKIDKLIALRKQEQELDRQCDVLQKEINRSDVHIYDDSKATLGYNSRERLKPKYSTIKRELENLHAQAVIQLPLADSTRREAIAKEFFKTVLKKVPSMAQYIGKID